MVICTLRDLAAIIGGETYVQKVSPIRPVELIDPRDGRTRDTMISARSAGKMVTLVNAYSHKSCVPCRPGAQKFRSPQVFLLPICDIFDEDILI